MMNAIKLTDSNYLMWSRQVYALLDCYALVGHLNGSLVVPSPTIVVNNSHSVNPEYTLWKRQDQLIFSALLGAISQNLQSLVSRADNSAAIWETLGLTYAKPSRTHIRQLRDQLKNWKKGSMMITAYVQGLTTKFDQLALLGKLVDHEDHIDHIIAGLPEEYKPIIDHIEGRETPPSITEVHECLLNHELRLQTAATLVTTLVPITVNAVNYRPQRNNNNTYNNRGNSFS